MDNITNDLLSQILAELQRKNLGFSHPPKQRYIYANRQYAGCLWYFWDGAANSHEPIEFHALTGRVVKLSLEESEFKGKTQEKLNLHIEADRRYVVQSGFDTLFSKGLLAALDKLPIDAFSSPLTIAVEPGDTEQVLFCRVYDSTGKAVFAPYEEPVDWAKLCLDVGRRISPEDAGVEPRRSTMPTPPPIDTEVDPAGEWDIEPVDVSDLIAQIDVEMSRTGWTRKQGSEHLQRVYKKRTRAELEPSELRSFLTHLRKQASVRKPA